MGNEPRIIAGSCRSGTTWILDVLAETNDLRPVFEPLHPKAVPEAEQYASRYLAAGADEPGLKSFFDRIFAGAYHSIWTDYRVRPNRLLPDWKSFLSKGRAYVLFLEWQAATKRYAKYRKKVKSSLVLVKMIRANLMLGWLRENYDARIVFVVRHPGAVVESKMRIGGISWDPIPVLDFYRTAGVLGEYASRFRDLLSEDLSQAEAHTLIWCIENLLPLEQSREQNFHLAFYEKLQRLDGEREWMRIIKVLGLEDSPYGSAIVDRPSQQAASESSKQRRGGGNSWHDRIGSTDLEAIDRVLRVVGVSAYSAYDPMPVTEETNSAIK